MPLSNMAERPCTPSGLVSYLKKAAGVRLRGLKRWRIIYRPLICPFHELLALIPQGAKCFDLGCGAGTFLRLVAEMRLPTSLAGIEISRELVDSTSEQLEGWEGTRRFEVYDGMAIPDWVADYEYVTMIDVLHHIPADRQGPFLRSLFEKMKPGAKLMLKDIDAGQRFLVLFNKLHDLLISREVGHELPATEVQKCATAIGYEVLRLYRTRMWVYPHFTLVCEKPHSI
jgi:2-polyprenyl-3-methyl-5-hydroxy-6-metoxy-1,4-benzoquinol methylase